MFLINYIDQKCNWNMIYLIYLDVMHTDTKTWRAFSKQKYRLLINRNQDILDTIRPIEIVQNKIIITIHW